VQIAGRRMKDKQAGAAFDIIDHGSNLLLRYGRATKTAAHRSGTGTLVANVRGAMHHYGTGFGIIVKTMLQAV